MEQRYCYGCMRPAVHGPICPHCGYDNRKQNAPHQLPSGTVLQGKYLIGKALGQGGFGITYLGMDLALNMRIAIKEYYPIGMVMRESAHSLSVSLVTGAGDDRFNQNRARFLREAQTLARLENVPHVVQVRNFFSENNTAYIVMGYVEGITLREYICRKNGTLTPDALFRLLRPVMEAMDKVHALNLVHRDISPDNIMITPDGHARLIDFGAAHEATGEDDKSTQAVLKHGYAPVEQYQRKGKLGPWTDVYAMCATIYRCLSQKQPPNATDRLMGEDDFDWSPIPGLTEQQKVTLKKGLVLNPMERISSMSDLSRRLLDPRPILTAVTTPLPAPTAVKTKLSKEKPAKASPLRFLLPLATICAVAILGVFFLTKPDAIPEPPETQSLSSPEAATSPVSTGSLNPSGSNILMEQPVTDTGTAGIQIAFRTSARRNQICSVTMLNSTSTAPADAVDASQLGDQSVLAWVIPNGSLYDLYLAAEGGVLAPENCSGLFACFANLEDVRWEGAFYTSSTTDMSAMFYGCTALKDLDISSLDMGQVTNVSRMFSGTTALTNVTGNFRPEGLTDYEEFMDGTDLYNGKPWKKLFLGDMVLMEHFVEREHLTSAFPAFRTNVRRNQVVSITILPTTADAPKDAVDASYYNDGSVLAWTVPNGKYYDLYLAAEGGVTAPANSRSLFRGFTRVREIRFNNALDTSQVTNMSGFFYDCQSVTGLDLQCFDTSNVIDMNAMFCQCYALSTLGVSSFDTSQVTNMNSMFYKCTRLENPDLSSFDTSRVTDVCRMFYRTDQLADITANFSFPSILSYESFMDPKDTVNSQTWINLFE